MGQKRALQLFQAAAKRVPAYKKFLAEHHIRPSSIKTADDLARVPFVDKENYLRKYPLHELAWDGEIGQASMISRSSGSSGQPFYWLSNEQQRDEVGQFYDLVFSLMFDMKRKNTLVIIAYGMGSWVAGTTTLLSSIGYMNQNRCTFVTPGYNKNEVIEICKNLGPEYDQVVICAYPPLVKEIIDLGREQGISWPKLKPKFIFGAEAFSEELRDYMLEQIGSKNPLMDTMNTIGSADAMVIGHETPLSIALRRMIHADEAMHNDILGPARMPTLAQYYPWQKHLEIVDNELLITSDGAIPLIRYNIHDNAKIYSYKELKAAVKAHGHDSLAMALPAKLRDDYDWKLPFVLLYGKSTNAVKLYGAIVYPENIKAALEQPTIANQFTGKFRMQIFHDAHHNQRLRLYIELAPGVTASQVAVRALQTTLVQTICSLNTEYKAVYSDLHTKVVPMVRLVPYGQFDLNNVQNKHKYV
jgi:phenylacetate-CoA ligase